MSRLCVSLILWLFSVRPVPILSFFVVSRCPLPIKCTVREDIIPSCCVLSPFFEDCFSTYLEAKELNIFSQLEIGIELALEKFTVLVLGPTRGSTLLIFLLPLFDSFVKLVFEKKILNLF